MNITAAAMQHTAYTAPAHSREVSRKNTDETVEDVKNKDSTVKPETEESGKARPVAPRYDEFVPSKDTAAEPADKKPDAENKSGAPKSKSDDTKPEEEECTVNTDKVDAEIERLKKKKKNLEAQIRQAADDPEKAEKLKREKASVEAELMTKDNDNYRKQHSTYTNRKAN